MNLPCATVRTDVDTKLANDVDNSPCYDSSMTVVVFAFFSPPLASRPVLDDDTKHPILGHA